MKNHKDKMVQESDAPLVLPQDINDVFDSFFELDPAANMFDRFDALSHALIAFRFYLLDRHRKSGKPRITAEEVFLFDCQEQLREIEKVIMSAKKLGRLGIPNENYSDDLLAKIVKMKGAVGNIVRNVPIAKTEGGDGK